MHPLTTSDLAFLLCTSSSSSSSSSSTTTTTPPKSPLSLSTTYGLQITLSADGSLSISLSPHKPPHQSPPLTPGSSLDSILHSPTTTTIPNLQPPQDRHYLLSPDFATSTYFWSPSSQSLDEWLPADETLLESLYSGGELLGPGSEGGWFDEYLDWVGRAEDQLHGQRFGSGRPRESDDSFISVDDSPIFPDSEDDQGEIFQDEGERTLWLVEGVLLAAWLALQEGVEGVGYRPGGFGECDDGGEDDDEGVYLLEQGGKASLGEVVGGLLRDVRS